MANNIFIDCTLFKVTVKYWLFSMHCALHPFLLFNLGLVACISYSVPFLCPSPTLHVLLTCVKLVP